MAQTLYKFQIVVLLVLAIAPLSFSQPADSNHAEGFYPFEGPKPVVVFIETDPWAVVRGAENPRFALYEDRTVLFTRTNKDRSAILQAHLSVAAYEEVVQKCIEATTDPKLKRYYDIAPGVTDQPQARFYFDLKGSVTTTVVRGLKTPETKLLAWTEFPTERKPATPSKKLLQLHQDITSFKAEGEKEWIPDYLEVMASPYENAPEESIHWPKDWPGLNSKRTFSKGDYHLIFLDGSNTNAIQMFLAKRRRKGAVEIDSKKYSIAWRHTYPSDPVWRAAFEKMFKDLSQEKKQ